MTDSSPLFSGRWRRGHQRTQREHENKVRKITNKERKAAQQSRSDSESGSEADRSSFYAAACVAVCRHRSKVGGCSWHVSPKASSSASDSSSHRLWDAITMSTVRPCSTACGVICQSAHVEVDRRVATATHGAPVSHFVWVCVQRLRLQELDRELFALCTASSLSCNLLPGVRHALSGFLVGCVAGRSACAVQLCPTHPVCIRHRFRAARCKNNHRHHIDNLRFSAPSRGQS